MRSQKSKKLETTYFVQDANGKNLNPDLGSKNKRPDFPRPQIAKQLHLPQKGAEVRVLGAPATQLGPSPAPLPLQPRFDLSVRFQTWKISKLGVCSQASLLPRPCVPHQSLPPRGVWVMLMLFRVTSGVRAAGESVTAAPVTPEPSRSKKSLKNPKWSSCTQSALQTRPLPVSDTTAAARVAGGDLLAP